MLIAEDLLLLLTDDRSGRTLPVKGLDAALGGAVLLELSMTGAVDVDERSAWRGGPRIVVVDPLPPADAELAAALAGLVARPGRTPASAVGTLGRGLRARLLARLAQRGVLREQQGRVLGLVPTRRWPTADPAHERAVRVDLVRALVTGAEPSPRTAALVSLLLALGAVHRVVEPREHATTRRELERRARACADAHWAPAAVRSAVRAMSTAVGSAVTAGPTSSGSAGVDGSSAS